MKKLITTSLLVAALVVVPAVGAEETVTCSTSQYGGAVCGVSTSSETVIKHETVDTGIADWSIVQIIAFAGITAVAASLLYKASYRWYILG